MRRMHPQAEAVTSYAPTVLCSDGVRLTSWSVPSGLVASQFYPSSVCMSSWAHPSDAIRFTGCPRRSERLRRAGGARSGGGDVPCVDWTSQRRRPTALVVSVRIATPVDIGRPSDA